jgi:hypothetical protein
MGNEPNREKPVNDAQPDPEPAVPSLPEPDPGVFHHEPGHEQPETKKHS